MEVREPHPLRLAAVAAVLWPVIRVAGRRYTLAAWGDGAACGPSSGTGWCWSALWRRCA
ncbi:hypothetical protein O1M54_42430 [Streptomyces diastatochromogenes]|nr:hypothetical protein [Streptomyces diastatochromogenes]